MEKVKTHHKPHHAERDNFYPKLSISNNDNPKALYAFPLVGLVIKVILLIPALFFLAFVAIGFFFMWLITPFVILFTGKYWDPAYKITLGFMIYRTKVTLFLIGLTDTYPGFNLKTNDLFSITMKKPTTINRWFAFPIAGFAIRLLLMLPYNIYKSVLESGTWAATAASWFAILGNGKYPESLYEFNRDSLRVSLAHTAYLSYLSDSYPSFWISMKHKSVKITLIIIGAILFLLSYHNDRDKRNDRMRETPMRYDSGQPFVPRHDSR